MTWKINEGKLRTKERHFGYLWVDHRASPGLPEDFARKLGMDPRFCGEGKVYECKTLGCRHCGAHLIENPWRTRERGYCHRCDAYICDACWAAVRAGCVHRTIEEIADLIGTGRWALSGNMSRPIVTPVVNW